MNTEPLMGLDWRGISLILTLALTLGGGLVWLVRQNREDLVTLEADLERDRAEEQKAEEAAR